jgi:hypothetical protein
MKSLPTPGAIYFLVAYLDRALRIPKIETYFCVGRDAAEKAWYFQQAESFVKNGPRSIADAPGDPDCLRLDDEHVDDGLLDWDGLVKELADNKAIQDQGRSLSERG